MTVQEIRRIREKKSIEWANLSLEQRNEEIKNGAKQLLSKIEEIKLSKTGAGKVTIYFLTATGENISREKCDSRKSYNGTWTTFL